MRRINTVRISLISVLFRMFHLPPTAINIDKALIVLLLDGQCQVVEVPVQKALELITSK